ncbi:4Fe-4S binding protein [Parabacteroides sp. PF5-9]|uniref:4Fe-4S binding protein n=1 Tax=Parabacteroides sp. PF5-9 TaxID=1742404 RepID=UPI002477285C|nr:4Fe-4S binding protein [Parabacteroides sp. PF5-9]MDH6356490.1 ferredoxin [Parabacteroides sp. PF5-9]
MKSTYLKGLRVILAILFFTPILLFFLDFRNQLPEAVSKLLHTQLFPAILAGFISVLIVQFVLALCFGRIYCSVICPAGVLQDIINRVFCIGKKKKKGSRRFTYRRPMNILRYVLMGLTLGLALLGFLELGLLLDPYSNFGRIAANLFRPAAIWINNIFADVLARFDNYTLYHVTIGTVTTAGLIAGFVALAVFIGMVVLRGRLFCNTLCPVGALLSLVSRYSFFKITIDKKRCISCGICEQACKAEAIDVKNMKVDNSRCVDCFNCVSSCKKESIHYRFQPFFKKEESVIVPEATASMEVTPSAGRRSFLSTGATVVASLPVVSAVAQVANGQKEKVQPVTPPGSISLEQFKDKCTGCHICVVQCPSQVLYPAGLEYGFGYMLKPHMAYIDSYCNYECTVCMDVCPNHALRPLTVDQKVTTQVGIAEFFLDRCIVETENTDCGACSEHCPTQAVHMELYKEGSTLTVPVVEPELCIGCGGCESICPVRPNRAIIIKANEIHQTVEKPAEEEVLEIEIDGFGF